MHFYRTAVHWLSSFFALALDNSSNKHENYSNIIYNSLHNLHIYKLQYWFTCFWKFYVLKSDSNWRVFHEYWWTGWKIYRPKFGYRKKSKAHVWVMKRKNSVYSCLRSCWAAKCRCLSPPQWVEINYLGAFLFSYPLAFCLWFWLVQS